LISVAAVSFAAALLAAASLAYGDAPTTAEFLKISTAPRVAALGEASVAVTDATWAEANPAHLTFIDGSLFTFSHAAWFQDISLEMLEVGTSSGRHGFGVSVIGLHTEPLEEYSADDRFLGEFRYYDLLVGATYAYGIRPDLRAGVTAKTIYEKIGWDSATGFAVDLGLDYRVPAEWLSGDLSAGLAVRNLGTKMSYFEEKFDLPLTWQGGLAYRPSWVPGPFKILLSADYRSVREGSRGMLFGLEVALANAVAVRAGAKSLTGEDSEGGNGTVGIGVNLKNIMIDYSYVDFGNRLGATHRVSLALKAGRIFPTPEASR